MSGSYTIVEINAALRRVEEAKHNHPVGWGMLDELGLGPSDSMVNYAFMNAKAHEARLNEENDRCLIYATGWLQGLAVGASLRKDSSDGQ